MLIAYVDDLAVVVEKRIQDLVSTVEMTFNIIGQLMKGKGYS